MSSRLDVLCVGLQVIDLLVSSVDELILHRETTNVDAISLLLGGDALNQAIALSGLGAKVGLMGAVGNDSLGKVLINRLQDYPLEILSRVIEAKTGISVVLIDQTGERHFVLQTGHNEHFCYNHIDEDAVRRAGIVSIGSCMSMRRFDGADALRLLELAHSAGAMTAIDFKANYDGWRTAESMETIRVADYVLPSEQDVRMLTGANEDDPRKMVQGMRDLGAKNIVIKLGERGCYVSAEGVETAIPPCPCKCIDTTGAGDCFVAAFLYGKSRGWDVESCARFANAAGSIAVEHPGANGMIRSEAQVLRRLRGEA